MVKLRSLAADEDTGLPERAPMDASVSTTLPNVPYRSPRPVLQGERVCVG